MTATETIIKGVKDLCVQCGACVRACPVKAIKIISGQVDIVDERCIYCGRCLNVCTVGAITTRRDSDLVNEMLKNHRVVAIVAAEIFAAFPGLRPVDIRSNLTAIGFHGVEENIIGEEMVAREYLTLAAGVNSRPLIRSTCAAVVEAIEKYHPEMTAALAPVVSPMTAQARLIKKLYRYDVKVVYIGPCLAKKREIEKDADSVDAVLTFNELPYLAPVEQLLQPTPAAVETRPALNRALSLSDGFPRTLLNEPALNKQLIVGRGGEKVWSLISEFTADKQTAFFDLTACRGCIDGPAMTADVLLEERRQLTKQYYQGLIRRSTVLNQAHYQQVMPDLKRTYTARPVKAPQPTAAEIRTILKQGGKETLKDELNCGICGYDTCREYAVAVYQGLADWGLCFPWQKKIYLKSTAELKAISAQDGLTGLANHRSFKVRLQEEFQRARRYNNKLSLMMMDVDKFKYINDAYGHLAGDKLLKLTAEMIRRHFRETDFAARYGGDEFAVILPQTDGQEAFKAAEKLRRAVAHAAFFINGENEERREKITLSIGVGELQTGDSEPHDLVARADKAMYKSKESGRNQSSVGR